MNAKSILTTVLFLAAGFLWSQESALPAGEAETRNRLNGSPRHGEWIVYEAEGNDKVEAWIVYPQRTDKAPVVVVIHENRGLNDWARAVADQFAAEGFIAIAPDFLSGKAPGGAGTKAVDPDGARELIGKLGEAELMKRLRGAVNYGLALPAASDRYGVVGYCWGGSVSFTYATYDAGLRAAVVFYGTSPKTEKIVNVRAPVLGLYGGADNRVNATIALAAEEFKKLGKRYEVEVYEGAGHAFLRIQDGQNGANLAATKKSWPRTVEFLKKELEAWTSSSDSPRLNPVLAAAEAEGDCDGDCSIASDVPAPVVARNR